jgi:pimeloyl-ACP methyl ester carboxylesterase
MNQFLRRDIRQMRRSWYVLYFQIPWLPELVLRLNNFHNLARVLHGSSHKSFSKDDVAEYKKAWSQAGALTGMLNWYRALARFRPRYPRGLKVKPPTMMIWGMNDSALSHRMARPSIDFCENGRLVLFEEASHWVQHDVGEDVNQLLLVFIKG